MGVSCRYGSLSLQGFCNGWEISRFRELVTSFRQIGLGVDDRGFGLPGGWARLDYAAGIEWQAQIAITHLSDNFFPAYSEEVWLDSVFADDLLDTNAEVIEDGRLICVSGERVEVRRALFCINGLLQQGAIFIETAHSSAGPVTVGPWFEGPAIGLRCPRTAMSAAFGARDDGAPRVQQSVVVVASLSSEYLRSGRLTADDPEFIADTDRCMARALLSLRRTLAATWHEEVDPESNFVDVGYELDGLWLTITLSGELNDAQTNILLPFVETTPFQYTSKLYTHVTALERVS